MLDFNISEYSSREKIKMSGKPVVIYGMGNGADSVIDNFEKLGIPVLGITASDDFVRNQKFRGFTVKRLSDFEGDFILCPAFGTNRPEVIDHILNLGKKHEIIVPVVPVFGDNISDREFIKNNEDKINEAYELFDDKSKDIFAGCVDFMFGGNLETLFSVTTPKEEAFENILKPGEGESYLDLGAYRGDTIDELLRFTNGKYKEIIAVEPDEKTFRKLCEHTGNMVNIKTICKAISDKTGKTAFSSLAGRQSAISAAGKEKECITVDDLCKCKQITYLKMDIEGAEKEGILGAKELIKLSEPKLNIALYHRSEDIFTLPLLINSINPGYKFHLRRHPYIPCWDMNLYCV